MVTDGHYVPAPPGMRRLGEFSTSDWLFLTAAVVVTAFAAIGAHDLAIAHLDVPYPNEDGVPEWARYLGQIVRVGCIVAIARLGAWYLDRFAAAGSAAIMGIVIVMLQETVRVLIVNVAMVDGLVDARWQYMLIGAVPGAVSSFFNGAAGALIARRIGRSVVGVAAATLLVAAIGLFALLPISRHAAVAAQSALGLAEPAELYQMPYGLYIYSFIYATFVEPTLATFFLAFILWPSLPDRRRVIAFVALLLLVRGRVLATFLFSTWVRQPAPLAIAAEGQFFVETLVMALLAGLAWDRTVRRWSGNRSR